MFDIANYTSNMRFLLGEGGKYFLLLVLSVLAIRLWRRWINITRARNVSGLLCAVVVTVSAVGVGYVSVRQSLSLLYSHYGMKAFREDRLPQALILFQTADQDWQSANTVGQIGVCRLLLGKVKQGLDLISQARTMRKGKGAPFEDFYEGVYYYTKGDNARAIPLLQAAGKNDAYRWSVIKIFAVMELDQNRIADVEQQMKPFMQADVTEFDQAYIMAALKLADGQKKEARALLDKFSTNGLSARWQSRVKKLREQLND